MSALDELHKLIDRSDWDIAQEDEINKAFQAAHKELQDANETEAAATCDMERQAFAFNKSPEKRLSFKLSGTRKLEDGTEVPFEWPDLRTFTEEDFTYLFKRFYEAKNIYAKTEYGLVLFYADHLVQMADVFLLLENLFSLAKNYIDKGKQGVERNYYITFSRTVIANALHIAEKRKGDEKISSIYRELILFVITTHQEWDVKHKYGLRVIIDFTRFAIDYFKDFKLQVDVSLFIKKNWEAAVYLSTTYAHGAIYVADISIRLSKKIGMDTKEWHRFKAVQYEKLSEEAKQRNNIAAVTFLEKAMEIYKGLKDDTNYPRLQNEYQNVRNHFKMGKVRSELPQDESQRIAALIKKEVSEGHEENIITTLLFTPMIRPLSEIKTWADQSFKEHVMLSTFPASVQDKFGNTIAQYTTEDERRKFSLLQSYGFHMQIATQTILQYFIEAFRAEKITSIGVINFFKKTWMGNDGVRVVNGNEVTFSFINLVEPGIQSIFAELKQWKVNPDYLPNLVSATDSLVLKAEYLLREFCIRLSIPTFKEKPRDGNIVMERTLDDLLIVLEDKIKEDDHFFIKFILTEKAGYNLRNRIAHGLMDDIDYGLEYAVLALIIILKLSNYQFVTKEKI